MSTTYPYHLSPRWPLIASIVLHVGFVGLLFWSPDPATDSSEGAPQSVELWASPEVMDALTQDNPTIPQEPHTQQSMPPIKGDIVLSPSAVVQRNSVRPNPAPSTQSTPLLNARRTVDAALSTLKTPASNHTQQSTKLSASDMDAYKKMLIHYIATHMRKPLGRNFSIQVQIRTAPSSMEIIFVKVVQSSGNTEHDQLILQTIQKIGKLPPLPIHADPNDWRSITLNVRFLAQ